MFFVDWYYIGPLRAVGENATDREIFDVKTLLKEHYNRTVKFDRYLCNCFISVFVSFIIFLLIFLTF